MSKVWQFLSALLTGVIVGIILWEKIDYKAVFKGKVKIKQKGEGNTIENITDITVQEARALKRQARQNRREQRKAKRNEKND